MQIYSVPNTLTQTDTEPELHTQTHTHRPALDLPPGDATLLLQVQREHPQENQKGIGGAIEVGVVSRIQWGRSTAAPGLFQKSQWSGANASQSRHT